MSELDTFVCCIFNKNRKSILPRIKAHKRYAKLSIKVIKVINRGNY